MTQPLPIPDGLPTWHVLGNQISTTETLLPGNAGLAWVHDIPYQIDSGPAQGLVRHVRVNPDDFNPAAVQDAIVVDLNAAHGIASLDTRGA